MARRSSSARPVADPLWFKDAVVYEVHVRAFCDSDGDGIGDFPGLTSRLDYLADLGVTALWLLPFYPSPLRDDGYDIADYTDVHPSYGTLRDFREFLDEAHRRGIRVITELVINHTSDQHAWFARARRPGAARHLRDFYVWSDTPQRYEETRIIFQDFESSNWSWDPVAKAYYWHRFYSHQPDLNFDSPAVRQAVFRAMDFWLKMGVDGLRLDAVPYLFEREGTNCENLPETHGFLKDLRAHVDRTFPERMLLAEANQWPEDAAAYFGAGDECHMCFHFPLMPRLFMAVTMEDRFPILDILDQTPPIPESCQWGLFLRNHDELTLEMVTDEERDYMYRAYANDPRARINLGIRRRLAPLLGNNRRRIELMNAFLLSLPGTPILYYGDELGMGDNFYLGDRNGVRTPMQWSSDRNAGFSRANPQRLYLPVIIDPEYHYESINVEAQRNNPSSLFWFTKRIIALRRQYRAFSRGSLEFLYPENNKVIAYVRRWEDEKILVVANLSRFAQHVELDLSAYSGMVPVELFGHTPFPRIGESPYAMTLGPHGFFWFALERAAVTAVQRGEEPPAALPVPELELSGGDWQAVLGPDHRPGLERVLAAYLPQRRWYGGKARRLKLLRVVDAVPLAPAVLLFVQAEYVDGEAETYVVPVAFVPAERVAGVLGDDARLAICTLTGRVDGVLIDAVADKTFTEALLAAIERRRRARSPSGTVQAVVTEAGRRLLAQEGGVEAAAVRAEQSNTSIVYGQRFILKLFRRLQPGTNPDLEIGGYLTRSGFERIPAVAGWLDYQLGREPAVTLGILQEFVPNQGDAWSYTLDSFGRTFEELLARPAERRTEPPAPAHPLEARGQEPPEIALEIAGHWLPSARLLGERTAELHLALTADTEVRDFAPEAFSTLYQRSLFQSMRTLLGRTLTLVRAQRSRLTEELRAAADEMVERRDELQARLRAVSERKITARRSRIHGDYHLGQVLWTGKDFVIIDFEGEPARPLSERRIKRSPLRDVAGMLRSFDYAAHMGLRQLAERGLASAEQLGDLEPWARAWYEWASGAFLDGYLRVAAGGRFLPEGEAELRVLLDAYLLEKAVYELGYELNNRPEWVGIPLHGILDLLGPRKG